MAPRLLEMSATLPIRCDTRFTIEPRSSTNSDTGVSIALIFPATFATQDSRRQRTRPKQSQSQREPLSPNQRSSRQILPDDLVQDMTHPGKGVLRGVPTR